MKKKKPYKYSQYDQSYYVKEKLKFGFIFAIIGGVGYGLYKLFEYLVLS